MCVAMPVFVCADVLAGNIESILTLCNSLRTHFMHSSGTTRSTKLQKPHAMEKEDMRILAWVGQQVGKEISSYSVYVVEN